MMNSAVGDMSEDLFLSILPVLIGPNSQTNKEPNFSQLHGLKTRNRYIELARQRQRLSELGEVAGAGLVILYSNVGNVEARVEVNGTVREVTDRVYSARESKEHQEAAFGIARQVATFTLNQTFVEVLPASREEIDRTIADRDVGHIIYVGHSNVTQIVPDTEFNYNWHDHGELTHLKRSLGVFGCATDKGDNLFPRIGSTLVDPRGGILYGVDRGSVLDTGQPYSFEQLCDQPLELLHGWDDFVTVTT